MIDDLTLPPGQRERLEQELLGAFGKPDLVVLARRLGFELAHIAEGSLKDVVSRFVEEVGRLGRGVALIRMARRANPTHPGLNKFLTTLRPRVFKGAQIDELIQLLQAAGLPWELLEQQFWLCAPDTWSSPLANDLQDEAERVADLVDVLSEYTESGLSRQVLPLFEFVLRLSHRPEAGAVAEQLRQWLERTARALGRDPGVIKTHGYRLFGELWLLVKIERVTAECFQVEAWLADSQNKYPRAIFKEEQSSKLEEIPDVLKRIWRQRELLAPLQQLGDSKLTVEFLLPRELLLHPVEFWRVLPGAPIGTRYQVVVRSLERAYAEVRPPLEVELQDLLMASAAWNTKWRALSDSPNPPPRPLWVCETTDHQGDRFLADLTMPEVVCMALTMTPPALTEMTLRELLHHCLLNGMPIALWIRKSQCVGAEIRTYFEKLLEDLSRLPIQVREARLEGFRSGDEGHLGKHLTLLWDDPTRVPADARLGSDFSAPFTMGVKG
jgi:hypothetical protein